MKNKNKKADSSNTESSFQVRVQFSHPTATAVAIAGTFNDWKPAVTPMMMLREGTWAKVLSLPPGKYEYLFVADGKWLPDPAARATVPNPFGGVNCVLEVPHASSGNGNGNLSGEGRKENGEGRGQRPEGRGQGADDGA
jgi:1,4-alpha-glucan branching enzyme